MGLAAYVDAQYHILLQCNQIPAVVALYLYDDRYIFAHTRFYRECEKQVYVRPVRVWQRPIFLLPVPLVPGTFLDRCRLLYFGIQNKPDHQPAPGADIVPAG